MSNEDRLWGALVNRAVVEGFAVVVRESASSVDAFVDHVKNEIVVAARLPRRIALARLAHEVGHVVLHGPGRDTLTPNAGRREIEAELFAFGVLMKHGVQPDESSAAYIHDWTRRIDPLSQADFYAIRERVVVAVQRFVGPAQGAADRPDPSPDAASTQYDLDGPEL